MAIDDVLAYWYGDQRWDRERDQKCVDWHEKKIRQADSSMKELEKLRDSFGKYVLAIERGQCINWLKTKEGVLAYIILANEIGSRLFKGRKRRYDLETIALRAARKVMKPDWPYSDYFEYHAFEKRTLLMPFIKAENESTVRAIKQLLSKPLSIKTESLYDEQKPM